MPYKYDAQGKRISKERQPKRRFGEPIVRDPHYPFGDKRFTALPDDAMVTVTWPGGSMSVNQHWLETTTDAKRRKFIDLAVKANKTQEEISNGHKKKSTRRQGRTA